MEFIAHCQRLALVSQVNAEVASLEFGVIQLVDSVLRILLVGKLDEAETFGAIGLSVIDDADLSYIAGLREIVAKIIFSCTVWEISNSIKTESIFRQKCVWLDTMCVYLLFVPLAYFQS